jgi:ABC-2 type transport system permease protein
VTAVTAVVEVTLRQILSGRRLLGLGALSLVPAVVMWLVADGLSPSASFTRFNEAPIAILFLIVLPVVSIVLGASALGDERRNHTMPFLVLRPMRRSTIVGAKLAAAWVGTLLVVLPGGIALAAVLGVRAGMWDTFIPVAAGICVTAACFTAVFTVLGLVTERAVLIGLIYLFVWESGVSSIAPSLANASLFRIGLSAYAGLRPEARELLDQPLGVIAAGAGGAAAKAAVIVVVLIAAGWWLLTRRDTV